MPVTPAKGTPTRSSGGREQRRTKRLKVFFPTEIVLGDVSFRSHVLDLSRLGSLLHTEQKPVAGSTIQLRLPSGECLANVAWVKENRIGLEFQHPVSDADLDQIIKG